MMECVSRFTYGNTLVALFKEKDEWFVFVNDPDNGVQETIGHKNYKICRAVYRETILETLKR